MVNWLRLGNLTIEEYFHVTFLYICWYIKALTQTKHKFIIFLNLKKKYFVVVNWLRLG